MDSDSSLVYSGNDCKIYKFNCEILGEYYLAIPFNWMSKYDLFIGLPKITGNEVITDVKEMINLIKNGGENRIYLLPVISLSEIKKATDENDNRLYIRLFDKIHAMINDVYKRYANDKDVNVNTYGLINMIEQDDSDSKFIDWLEIYTTNCFGRIKLSNILGVSSQEDTTSVKNDDLIDGDNTFGDGLKKVKTINNGKGVIGVSSNNSGKINDDKNSGFSSMSFIILVLSLSIVFGILIGVMIIK